MAKQKSSFSIWWIANFCQGKIFYSRPLHEAAGDVFHALESELMIQI